jgi:hypothetical protein
MNKEMVLQELRESVYKIVLDMHAAYTELEYIHNQIYEQCDFDLKDKEIERLTERGDHLYSILESEKTHQEYRELRLLIKRIEEGEDPILVLLCRLVYS